MKLSILGCGNWGSVFGIMQHMNGHTVKIWEFDRERAEHVATTRNNEPFLMEQRIPREILVDSDMEKVIADTDAIVFAIPSQVLHTVVERMMSIKNNAQYYVSLTKGIDIQTLRRPSEIIGLVPQSHDRVYVLSGPSIANEIIRGEPTATVLVGRNPDGARTLQHQLTTENFRIYQSDDMIGVELCAAIKNIIAIGCGISYGLGFGNNAKGALITRGIVEMQRFGVLLGAQPKTFWGLAGLGDMVTTSFSTESRNHRFGTMIGKDKTKEQAVHEMVMVAEGVPTSRAVKMLAEKHTIDMPICRVVYEILYEGKPPRQGLKDLMTRPLKYE